jgi:hypothetical protein
MRKRLPSIDDRILPEALGKAARVFDVPVVLTTVETSGRMPFAFAVAHLRILVSQ